MRKRLISCLTVLTCFVLVAVVFSMGEAGANKGEKLKNFQVNVIDSITLSPPADLVTLKVTGYDSKDKIIFGPVIKSTPGLYLIEMKGGFYKGNTVCQASFQNVPCGIYKIEINSKNYKDFTFSKELSEHIKNLKVADGCILLEKKDDPSYTFVEQEVVWNRAWNFALKPTTTKPTMIKPTMIKPTMIKPKLEPSPILPEPTPKKGPQSPLPPSGL